MSWPRKILYWIWVIIMIASFDGWLVWLYPETMRWWPIRKETIRKELPFPFVGLEAAKRDGFKEVTIKIQPVPVRTLPAFEPLVLPSRPTSQGFEYHERP